MRKLFNLACLAALLILSGCATNPMTGRQQLSLVSENSVMAKSTQLYASMISTYDKKGKVVNDPALNERVRKLTNRLVEQALQYRPNAKDWDWQVSVIDDENINASCMPGGKMVVFKGLIEKIEPTDDELAQVMGHEIAHALANHGAEKMSVSILANVAAVAVATAAAVASNNPDPNAFRRNQRMYNDVSILASNAFISLPNSRGAEEEADKLGIEIAARAGYQPQAAVTLWEKMMKATGQTSRFDFLATHPASPKRIESLEALQPPMLKIYEERAPLYASYKAPFQYVKTATADPNVKEVSAANLAAEPQVPEQGKALTFYSENFEKFKQGNFELTCTNCSLSFAMSQNEFKKLYDEQDWRALAQKVMKSNYQLDLAYFYLSKAAEGLGYEKASKSYLDKASELSALEDSACAKGVMIKCQDLDIASLAKAD
ncbi:MAG TPA: M48 family metallopeptidase [Methylophilaceae bacterium]|nr:M48 family metallopeptidase [Methylophilaceae bacterium]